MAFLVTVDSSKLLQQFDDVLTRVTELDRKLPNVFMDWQRDDMNRKYPRIDDMAALSVTTTIHPRSRRVRPPRVSSGKKTERKKPRRITGVKRPILRPELVEQLFDRMRVMCQEAIEWH